MDIFKPKVFEQLGSELYVACAQNNVAQVEAITSKAILTDCSLVMMTAALHQATYVAKYCLEQAGPLGVVDDVLYWILANNGSDAAYHFLVESNIVHVNHSIEMTGTPLSMAADTPEIKRPELVRYMLEKGADPNQKVERRGRKTVLACAAVYSDLSFLRILLHYGAELGGSGALVSAVEFGRIGNLKFLIDHGADLNEMRVATVDDRSLAKRGTALHKAVEMEHIDAVDVLLHAGANKSIEDAQGRTAEEIAVEKGLDAAILRKLKPD